MITITSFADVVAVANTFGVQALRHAMDNHKVSPDTTALICNCMAWAARQTLSVEDVNDGNVQYCIDVVFTSVKVGDHHFTNLNDMTVIRTGFGAFELPVIDAMEQKEISTEQLSTVLTQINLRNKAASAFGF